MAKQQGKFLTGSTFGHVSYMTLTGALGITFMFCVDALNLFWISQLGERTLVAAMGYAFAIQYFTLSAGLGLMIATTALVARSIGQKAYGKAREQASAALIITCLWQVGVVTLVLVFRHDLLAAVGASGEAADLADRYLQFTLPSLVLMAVGMIGGGILRAKGEGAHAMSITLIPGVVALVIDPLFIIWMQLGLDGAALALCLMRGLMATVALWLVIGHHKSLARPTFRSIHDMLKPFFAIALPAMLTQMATPFGNYLLTGLIAGFGDSAVAAWAVVGRLTVVAFGGIFSLSGAIAGIFSQNYGAGLYHRVRATYRDALIFCALYSCVMWGILMLASQKISLWFSLDPAGNDVLYAFTHFGAGGFILIGALMVSNAAFNALGKPLRSTQTNWLRDGVLTLPIGMWLTGMFGATGVIYAQTLVGAAVGLMAALWGWIYVSKLGVVPSSDLELSKQPAYGDDVTHRRQ